MDTLHHIVLISGKNHITKISSPPQSSALLITGNEISLFSNNVNTQSMFFLLFYFFKLGLFGYTSFHKFPSLHIQGPFIYRDHALLIKFLLPSPSSCRWVGNSVEFECCYPSSSASVWLLCNLHNAIVPMQSRCSHIYHH